MTIVLFTFQASSPKPLGQLEPNLAGIFLGWSSTKLLFFVLVGYSIWLPGPIMCSDWLKFQLIIATGPCITNQLRDVNTIRRRNWYIAAHIWKIYDFKIEVYHKFFIFILI
jgi:hypothetical protein